jgi:hypothetical protein
MTRGSVLSYRVHGLSLAFTAAGGAIAAAVDDILSPFASQGPEPGEVVVEAAYGAVPDREGKLPGMRLFWEGALPRGPAMAFYTGEGLRCAHVPGLACLHIDLALRHVHITVRPGAEWAISYCCVVPMLCEFLAERGQHVVHSASLAAERVDGAWTGVIVAGPSGRGKTTTALALAHSGMRLLSDDATFLWSRDGPDGLALWGLPRRVKVHSKSLGLLPWLAELPSHASGFPDERWFDLRCVSRVDPAFEAPVGLVLMLEGYGAGEHEVFDIEKLTALRRLVGENVRAFDPRANGTAGRAFGALSELVRECPVYGLRTGRDPATLHRVVLPLLTGT